MAERLSCGKRAGVRVLPHRPFIQLFLHIGKVDEITLQCSMFHDTKYLNILSWCYSEKGTPVLFPNTEVKLLCTDGTSFEGE